MHWWEIADASHINQAYSVAPVFRRDRKEENKANEAKLPTLVLGALGVVYGDLGTSPFYALKETFAEHHPL